MSGTGTYGGYGPQTTTDYPPGPAGWTAGASFPLRASGQLYANDLNAQLSAPVSFLAKKPVVVACQQTAQTGIPTGTTPTALVLDTEVSDAWYMQSNPADLSQLVCPVGCDGLWAVSGQCPIVLPAGAYSAQAAILHNGSVYSLGSRQEANGAYVTPVVSDLVPMAAGDYIQLGIIHNAASGQATFIGPAATPTGYLLSPAPTLAARWVAGTQVSLQHGGIVPATAQLNPSVAGPVYTPVPAMQLGPVAGTTWTDGQAVPSATLTTDITVPVMFLSNVPAFRVNQTAATSVTTAGSVQQVSNLQVDIDNWVQFAAFPYYIAPIAGLYLCGGAVEYASASAAYYGAAHVGITHAGATQWYPGAQGAGLQPAGCATRMVRLAAGDEVQLGAYQTSGATQSTVPAGTRFWGVWVSE